MRFMFNVFSFFALLIVGIGLAAPYVFFPRPNPESPQVGLVQAAKDLDQYVKESESSLIEDIKPGLEKTITWFDPTNHSRTDIAVVYLHGWSASRKDTAPLISLVANRLHANVYYARLTAHGLKRPDDFEKLKMQNLIDDAREALEIGKRLGKHVLLIGISTGATLAVEQAVENRRSVEPSAVVLLSPNFMPRRKDARFATGPFGRLIARAVVGTTYSFPSENSQHAEYWTTSYPSDGLVPMMDLVNYTNSLDLKSTRTPVLILYTHLDQLVNITVMHRKFEEWGKLNPDQVKDMVDLEGATRHELVGDLFGPQATVNASDVITDFTRNVISKK